MINDIQNSLTLCLGKAAKIPYYMQPTRFFEITFEGWKDFTIILEDPSIILISKMIRYNLLFIVKTYKGTHAFSEPYLTYLPKENSISLRIGLMELDTYKILIDRKEHQEKGGNWK